MRKGHPPTSKKRQVGTFNGSVTLDSISSLRFFCVNRLTTTIFSLCSISSPIVDQIYLWSFEPDLAGGVFGNHWW